MSAPGVEVREIGGARVIVVGDLADFAVEAARVVTEAHGRAIAARGAFAIALAGGSTPAPLHRALAAEPLRSQLDWSRVDVLFGDERAAAPDANESNFRAASDDLLQHLPIAKERVHRMEADRADLEGAARDYEARLRLVCDARPDLLCVGLGKDAHILSLYPGSPAIDEQRALVVAERDPPMNPALSRLTMTPRMLERAGLILALATGKEKAQAVARALQGELDPRGCPAHLLRRAQHRVWILDRGAAAGLTSTPTPA